MDRAEIIQFIDDLIRSGYTVAQMRRRILELPLGINPDELDAAQADFEEAAGIIRRLRQPAAAADESTIWKPWYTGPREADRFWPALQAILAQELPKGAVDSINRASTKIVSFLAPPGAEDYETRGLVLGHVQSGKTTNFAAVIAKAADAGYRMIVVLSGLHNSLRAQTQIRLQRYLRDPYPQSWHLLSDLNEDFINPGDMNATRVTADPDARLLVVIKKNATRLCGFLSWLQHADPVLIRKVPFLIIDDEADQASIDTSPIDDRDKRTAINDLVVRLLDRQKASYVGYTASPFANLLIDPSMPQQLYPRDFIVDLPRPEGYFGPERLFGRERHRFDEPEWQTDGLDMIRPVLADEVPELRPPRGTEARAAFEPGIPTSLRIAIRYFLLATAARRIRDGAPRHSTMLIHTTLYSDVQHRTARPVAEEIHEVVIRLEANDPGLFEEMRNVWEAESDRVPSSEVATDLTPIEFEQLVPALLQVARDVEIKVDNYRSDDRLDYTGGSRTVIVIGGNTLSRGLTLEGLVVSYFIRTASAYDTLLQMGRWFGYRRGYEDLPRIWMTDELRDHFVALATVESEIREDITRYEREGLRPIDFPIRIRTHPKLAVTSAMKMQAAIEAEVSYSGRRIQTILFEDRDGDWLENNLAAARELIRTSGFEKVSTGTWIARGIGAEKVLTFLGKYRFHKNAVDLKNQPLMGYIRKQRQYGELDEWNVAVLGLSTPSHGEIDLDVGAPVNLIARTRVNETGHANIKTLMSRPDSVVDLDVPEAIRDASWATQVEHRPAGTGLLLLYPIARDSRAKNRAGRGPRHDLNAVSDIIGVALAFPKASRSDSAQTYVAAPIPCDDIEEFKAVIEEEERIDGT